MRKVTLVSLLIVLIFNIGTTSSYAQALDSATIVLADDFSNDLHNFASDKFSIVSDGEYHVVNNTAANVTRLSHITLFGERDFVIESSIRRKTNHNEAYGICWGNDDYRTFFTIRADGNFEIFRETKSKNSVERKTIATSKVTLLGKENVADKLRMQQVHTNWVYLVNGKKVFTEKIKLSRKSAIESAGLVIGAGGVIAADYFLVRQRRGDQFSMLTRKFAPLFMEEFNTPFSFTVLEESQSEEMSSYEEDLFYDLNEAIDEYQDESVNDDWTLSAPNLPASSNEGNYFSDGQFILPPEHSLVRYAKINRGTNFWLEVGLKAELDRNGFVILFVADATNPLDALVVGAEMFAVFRTETSDIDIQNDFSPAIEMRKSYNNTVSIIQYNGYCYYYFNDYLLKKMKAVDASLEFLGVTSGEKTSVKIDYLRARLLKP